VATKRERTAILWRVFVEFDPSTRRGTVFSIRVDDLVRHGDPFERNYFLPCQLYDGEAVRVTVRQVVEVRRPVHLKPQGAVECCSCSNVSGRSVARVAAGPQLDWGQAGSPPHDGAPARSRIDAAYEGAREFIGLQECFLDVADGAASSTGLA
jgi:hypothetical protein